MKTKLILLAVIVLIIAWYISAQNNPEQTVPTTDTTPVTQTQVTPTPPTTKKNSTVVSTTSNQQTTGRLLFAVTDKSVPLDTISTINLTINSLKIHSPKTGWTTITSTPHSYDLFSLRNGPRNELLADVNLPNNDYDAIDLSLGSISVTKKTGGTVLSKVPSNDFQVNSNIKVIKGTIGSVLIDFLADKSLHTAIDGTIIFAPVVDIETKSQITVQTFPLQGATNQKVQFLSGDTNFNATLGMDENGIIKVNGGISPLANLEIVNDKIRIIPTGSY